MAHALALEDTIVVDDPDAEGLRALPWPAIPRTSTDELTMQVHVDGAYHRRIPTLSHTACEKPIHSQFADTRREELCHPLCREGCFTPFELRIADERAAKEESP